MEASMRNGEEGPDKRQAAQRSNRICNKTLGMEEKKSNSYFKYGRATIEMAQLVMCFLHNHEGRKPNSAACSCNPNTGWMETGSLGVDG